MGVRRREK